MCFTAENQSEYKKPNKQAESEPGYSVDRQSNSREESADVCGSENQTVSDSNCNTKYSIWLL